MTEVLTRTNVATPRGRKVTRKPDAEKCVKEKHSIPEGFIASTTTVDEAFDRLERKLETYYGK